VNRRSLLISLLLSLAAPAHAATQESAPASWMHSAKSWAAEVWSKDAGDWLERIGPALVELDYHGTLVMVAGTSMETLSVFHSFDDGHERMRLVTLTGAHREVIRDDKMVMCIGTGIESVGYDSATAGRWNPAGQFADAGKLDGYRAKLGKTARVADRNCQIVNLEPKDGWRYGYRLWLDHDTGLPLRIALIGKEGRALEQMAFANLQIGSKPDPADLRPSTQQGLRRIQTLDAGKQVDPGWRINSPPPGFTLRSGRRLGDSVQLLYSDGLASVSVYIEPVSGAQRGQSAMSRGAVNMRSFRQGGRRVVAIGKVPAATVDYFARNARPVLGKAGSGP
jgi:sigma-E factor negative regulatory protein RseB